jgi:hypothetical protein
MLEEIRIDLLGRCCALLAQAVLEIVVTLARAKKGQCSPDAIDIVHLGLAAERAQPDFAVRVRFELILAALVGVLEHVGIGACVLQEAHWPPDSF